MSKKKNIVDVSKGFLWASVSNLDKLLHEIQISVKMIIHPEMKVMEGKDNNFFSFVVVDIWFE